MEEKDVIRSWGSSEQYFTELQLFLNRHADADVRVHDTESGLLVKVEYYFKPVQVYREMEALKLKIQLLVHENGYSKDVE